MSLLDDTFDCCGKRFDPMGDPWLIRGKGYSVYCHGCRGKYPDTCSCRACVDEAFAAAEAEVERVKAILNATNRALAEAWGTQDRVQVIADEMTRRDGVDSARYVRAKNIARDLHVALRKTDGGEDAG